MSNPYAPPESDADAVAEPEPAHPVAAPPAARPSLDQDEPFVSVYTANDVIEAEMLTQMLEAQGIPTPGFNRATGAQVGAGWMAVGHVLRVPESRRDEARGLVDAFREGADDALPPEAGEDEPITAAPRSRFLRAGVLVLLAPTILAVLLALASLVLRLLPGR